MLIYQNHIIVDLVMPKIWCSDFKGIPEEYKCNMEITFKMLNSIRITKLRGFNILDNLPIDEKI